MPSTSAERIVRRPPHALVRASKMETGRPPLGHKPMSNARADEAITELVGLIANGKGPQPPIDPKMAEILSKVLDKHGRHKP